MITNLSEQLRAGLSRLTDTPASSPGHGTRIATQACELCVSAFADFCAIYLRSAGPHSVAYSHRDPLRYETLRGAAYDDLFAERAKATGVIALAEEPLIVKGRRIGTLVIGFGNEATRTQVTKTVVSLIASILATAIEQADELEHHFVISKRLQNAMLPSRLVQSRVATFDAAYRPASDEADVGGDWYDAFEIGNGTIGISVGDVTGHGLEAAVTMSEIRRAIRAAAAITDSPAALLNHVDAIVCAEAIGMATAIVGVFDPATGLLRYASAGHPSPVLLAADGNAHFLPAGGLLLGLGTNAASADYWVTLSPGSTCFFYTDGLLEYDRDIIAGEAALLSAIEAIAERQTVSAESLHAEVFRRAINTDDCATLAMHRSSTPDPSRERIVFSALPMCAGLVRQALRDYCERNKVAHEREFDILSAIGEAVANAIEHGDQEAGRPFALDLAMEANQLTAHVDSHGHWRTFNARDERGRGIPIMRSCSKRLEISSTHERTRITLTFDL